MPPEIVFFVLKRGFSQDSGLKLNRRTCELMAGKECDLPTIFDIHVKDRVTFLGVRITKDQRNKKLIEF